MTVRTGIRPPVEKRRHSKVPDGAYLTPVNWPGYVVSTVQLRDAILPIIPELQAQVTDLEPTEDLDDQGWRGILARQVAAILRRTDQAMYRRIYAIMSVETIVTNADIADAIMLACDRHLDYDTDVQTFPGNVTTAMEMVSLRRPDLKGEALNVRARRLLQYRDRVLFPNGHTVSKAAITRRAKKLAA